MITKSQKPRLSIQVSVPNNTQFLFWPATILMLHDARLHSESVCHIQPIDLLQLVLVCTAAAPGLDAQTTETLWKNMVK